MAFATPKPNPHAPHARPFAYNPPSSYAGLASRAAASRHEIDNLTAKVANGMLLSTNETAQLLEHKATMLEQKAAEMESELAHRRIEDASPSRRQLELDEPNSPDPWSESRGIAVAAAGREPGGPGSAAPQGVVAAAVARVRERAPLVQCFTSASAADYVASALLAAGASPLCIDAVEDAAEIAARHADAVSMDLGGLSKPTLHAMLSTASGMMPSDVPWSLAPAGCGLSVFRTEAARAFLALGPALIVGSPVDILSLHSSTTPNSAPANPSGAADVDKPARSPRAEHAAAAEAALPCAAALARAHGCVVVVAGPTDYVTDGVLTLAIGAGPEPTGLCQVCGALAALAALLVGFVACAVEGLGAVEGASGAVRYAAAGCAYVKACAAYASIDAAGPGTLKLQMLDALAMSAADVDVATATGGPIRIRSVRGVPGSTSPRK